MDTTSPRTAASPGAEVTVDGTTVAIDGLVVDEPALASLLGRVEPSQWSAVVERALAVGARGLLTMGLGTDLDEIDQRVRRTLEQVTASAAVEAQQTLIDVKQAMTEHFDPNVRTSMVSAALDRFGAVRDGLLADLDLDNRESGAARLVDALQRIAGPGGDLETQLRSALDPDADGSALRGIQRTIDQRFVELSAMIGHAAGKSEEAAVGTRKGFEFEDHVEALLARLARAWGGCTVERTGDVAGIMGASCKVGDLVVTLPEGRRVVVEVKSGAGQGLRGKNGILTELDRAMSNRDAEFAVCVSKVDAFPAEVGRFGVFGNRVLVVDDGDGTLLEAAMRWSRSTLATTEGTDTGIDPALLEAKLQSVRSLATRFESSKRALTGVQASVETIKGELGGMRNDLLDVVDAMAGDLRSGGGGSPLRVA